MNKLFCSVALSLALCTSAFAQDTVCEMPKQALVAAAAQANLKVNELSAVDMAKLFDAFGAPPEDGITGVDEVDVSQPDGDLAALFVLKGDCVVARASLPLEAFKSALGKSDAQNSQ